MTGDEEDTDLFNVKYIRVGHCDLGRPCDEMAQAAFTLLRGKKLPARWSMDTPEMFVATYGPGCFWARTQNYQLFVINGYPVFRLWTRTNAEFAWVDIMDTLVPNLKEFFSIEKIAPGNLKKCKPHTLRVKATGVDSIILLVAAVRHTYGLEST